MKTQIQAPPYFARPERIEALVAEARSWEGTPFKSNAAIKGAGVSCHLLITSIMEATGAWGPRDWPMGNPWHSQASRDSIIEPFLDSMPEVRDCTDEEAAPGDILGFHLLGCLHHVGIALPERMMVHSVRHHGVCIDPMEDPTWGKRLTRKWRPLDHEQ